jgi:hypothetical protein
VASTWIQKTDAQERGVASTVLNLSPAIGCFVSDESCRLSPREMHTQKFLDGLGESQAPGGESIFLDTRSRNAA